MTEREDPPTGDATSLESRRNEGKVVRSLPRRRVLSGVATGASVALSGCLSGPSVETSSLADSPVFERVAPAQSFSFGGNIVTTSVYLTPAAFDQFGVRELDVLTRHARPYSTTDAAPPPGPTKEAQNAAVNVPAGEPATISAVNGNGTTVESIRVTNDTPAFFTELGLGGKPVGERVDITEETMPTKILTQRFETHRTEFSTDAVIHGRIKNTAKAGEATYLTAKAVFKNRTGKVVERSAESLEGLSAGEVWDVVVPYAGDASDATDGTLTVAESLAGRSPIPPTHVTVLDDSLEQLTDPLKPPAVVGKVRNTGSSRLPVLEASAKFYTKNRDVLGDGSVSVTGLPAGKTWSFEVPFYAHSAERAKRVADYDLSIVA